MKSEDIDKIAQRFAKDWRWCSESTKDIFREKARRVLEGEDYIGMLHNTDGKNGKCKETKEDIETIEEVKRVYEDLSR